MPRLLQQKLKSLFLVSSSSSLFPKNLVTENNIIRFNLNKRFYFNRNLLSLKEKGLVSNVFPSGDSYIKEFVDLCNSKPQTIYAGFDPTADSLHIGNLAILMALLNCQRAGHNVIALIGGATALIGDPSGKKSERLRLENNVVEENSRKISKNIQNIFTNHELYFWDSKKETEPLPPLKILNNIDWYKSLSILDFFRDIGRHFKLGHMLLKQSVQSRLNTEFGISFTEFSYQIFQGYDWLYLFKNYDCFIQIGGNDQMGNIVAGYEVIDRLTKKTPFAMTIPLITTELGVKYGKTESGITIWLDSNKTSPFEMYQFFIRTQDSDVEKLLRIFTFRSNLEIDTLMKKHKEAPEKRKAQKELAKIVTLLVHGEDGLDLALKATDVVYSEDLKALSQLKLEDLENILKGSGPLGTSEISLNPGTTILDMSINAGCFKNKDDALRIIKSGGFYLNYQRVTNYDEAIVPGIHIMQNKITVARVGKKNYYLIKWLI